MIRNILSLCSIGILGFAAVAHADTMTFTGTGTTGSGLALDFTAQITTGAGGALQIVLTNLQGDTRSAAQELSGVEFTLSNNVTTQAKQQVSVADFSGNLITIASGGGTTAVTTDSTSFSHWGDSASGNTICVAAVRASCAEGGQPDDLVIGPGPYTNVNASVTNFNPTIQQTATFNFNFSGITASTDVTGITFYYGTGSDDGTPLTGVPGVPHVSSTPEPSSLMLLGTGIVGAAGMLRRRIIK